MSKGCKHTGIQLAKLYLEMSPRARKRIKQIAVAETEKRGYQYCAVCVANEFKAKLRNLLRSMSCGKS